MDTSFIKNNYLIKSYQIEGLKFLENHNGCGMINFDMGLGKTLTSLIYTVKNNHKTLVICPKTLMLVWADQINNWTNKTWTTIISKDKEHDYSQDITIINYDIVKKFLPQLQIQNFDCVILDESQKIKSMRASRSNAIKKLKIPHRILLTGTPITNRPLDLFSQLNYICPSYWSSWWDFRQRYIAGYQSKYGYFVETGTKNIEELAYKIKPFIIRRKKEDVENLPDKIYNKISIILNDKYTRQYQLAVANFKEFLKEYTSLGDKDIKIRLRGEVLSRIQALKQICSQYKISSETIQSLIENILDNNPNDKIVVFTQYRGIAKELYAKLDNSVIMHGEMDNESRQQSISEFQNNDKIKVFIGTIQCAGVGITLTRASNVIFVDLPWSPAELNQGIDRCHRIGTVKNVNIFYTVAKNTIEESIYYLLHNKQSTIDQILDSKIGKKTINVFNELLKSEVNNL